MPCPRPCISDHMKIKKMLSLSPGGGCLVNKGSKTVGQENFYSKVTMMDLFRSCFWHIQDYLSYGEVREGFQEEVSAELRLENQEIKAHKL